MSTTSRKKPEQAALLEVAARERPEREETKSSAHYSSPETVPGVAARAEAAAYCGMRLRSVSLSTTDILYLYPLMGEGFPRGGMKARRKSWT